ncbi:MAG: mechanosensitive ion channel [Candidatus Sulfopaludibacter sp.]|nr:mechanosensitive ion channel [Candidatus Sulfopaludibacter sp.]
MRWSKNLPAILASVLLAVCLLAWLETGNTGSAVSGKKAANSQAVVDDSLLRTAREMAAMADTPEEQDDAREALHLADHALDQAFATALRQAQEAPPPASADLRELNAQIDRLKSAIAADATRVAQLTKDAAANEEAGEQLQLAAAQKTLDTDELDDAEQDRARQGGDRSVTIERALQQHESDQKAAPPLPKLTDNSGVATVAGQVRVWFALASRERLLRQAQQQALDQAGAVAAQHNTLDRRAGGPDSAAPAGETTALQVARLHRLSSQRKTLAEFDKRVQDCQQLANVYKTWSDVVAARRRGVLHQVLGSLGIIFAIVLAVLGIDRAIRHAFHQADRKRLQQMRMLATVAVQLLAVAAILLILFGPPTQLSTIIGLATAGLTLVMRDFIVAFFGWFTLMGKNGIRVGDWVEVEGVSGEVIEIGILKTVLLERGNASADGHPTGRHVTFSNSFAMEQHYFNFSTSNQWLWDQFAVTLPMGGDPYRTVQQIHDIVERETRADAAGATEDWERVASKYGGSTFSAKPAVDLRPSGLGLDVVVRYITRAPERDAMKSRLFQEIVDLLHKGEDAVK